MNGQFMANQETVLAHCARDKKWKLENYLKNVVLLGYLFAAAATARIDIQRIDFTR